MEYNEIDQGIAISVHPSLDEQQSSKKHQYFFYTYTVTITNQRDDTINLKSREWRIKDGNGGEEIVKGEGVIGQFPQLKPGQTFTYTSFCPLRTETGNMRGFYIFQSENEQSLRVRTPLFFFRSPESLQRQMKNEH